MRRTPSRQQFHVTRRCAIQVGKLHGRRLSVAQIVARIDRSIDHVDEVHRELRLIPNADPSSGDAIAGSRAYAHERRALPGVAVPAPLRDVLRKAATVCQIEGPARLPVPGLHIGIAYPKVNEHSPVAAAADPSCATGLQATFGPMIDSDGGNPTYGGPRVTPSSPPEERPWKSGRHQAPPRIASLPARC
jgi:hypothetical protein